MTRNENKRDAQSRRVGMGDWDWRVGLRTDSGHDALLREPDLEVRLLGVPLVAARGAGGGGGGTGFSEAAPSRCGVVLEVWDRRRGQC